MNTMRAFELLSAALDGQLTPDEKAELDGLLAESEEARKLRDQLTELDQALVDLPSLDPPPGLPAKIAAASGLRDDDEGSTLFDWLSSISVGPLLRYAISFAVGALMVVAVYENQPGIGRASDITELVGTMAPDADTPNRRVLDSISVNKTGVSSVARLERRRNSLVVDIRLDTTLPVEIALDLSMANFEFEALAQTQSTLDAIAFDGNQLRVKGRGQRRFAVLLRSTGDKPFESETTIGLEYSSDGKVLEKGALKSAKLN